MNRFHVNVGGLTPHYASTGTVVQHELNPLKNWLSVIIFLLVAHPNVGLSQSNQYFQCDTLYSFAEEMPKYKNGESDFMTFVNDEIFPILSAAYSRDSILVTSITYSLVIDKNGNIIDVDFNKLKASDQCKSELKEKFLNMKGWSPGIINGISVCIRYNSKINCILWK